MSDTPFAPFAPFAPSTTTAPGPITAAVEKARKPRKTKAVEQKKTAVVELATPPAEKPARKKRAANKPKTPSPKFDLQTILAAAASLKDADMAAFEKLIGLLQDAGKPGRARLLAALGKVFR